ncbi:GDSL esterase/lipase At2g40250-like [Salvia miltiorrhiza]|uniref:GDSL esterase/lipase At2g40250-like n=1 Tax=Salvia miltiorrhiza TaxID=226208 RepID=UPI0025AC7094|nr:GDSL esterase/lipase At2g40250-like [Salvia miltiorrhiza]
MEKNSYLLIVFLLLLSITIPPAAAAEKPCAIYAFGDTVFDAGNNNKLATVCRANHKPYGVDFPGGSATGRFSNGKLPGDILAAELGIKDLLPAYAEAAEEADELLTGATFASSCSGFDDLTAREVGVLSLDKQFKNFQKAFVRVEEKFGIEKTTAAVKGGLFLVSGGSSDMMDNYYALPLTRAKYSLPAYHDKLLKNLEDFVKKLYNVGARRLAVIGLPPVGCLPMDVAANCPPSQNATANASGDDSVKRKCRSQHNLDAQEYNAKLEVRVKKMMVDMPNIKIVYMNIYNPIMDMINMPNEFGFKTTLKGCCGSLSVELGPLCNVFSATCPKRSEYVFWDSANPTEATYKDLTKIFQQKVLPHLLQ